MPSGPARPGGELRTGNLTGNFSGFGPFGRFLCPIDQINQRLAPKFPEHGGTGNFVAGNREFSRRNREFFVGSGNSGEFLSDAGLAGKRGEQDRCVGWAKSPPLRTSTR